MKIIESPHPYDLAVTETHLFWTDWKTGALHRANKPPDYSKNPNENTNAGGPPESDKVERLVTGMDGLMGLAVVEVRIAKLIYVNLLLLE